MSGLANKTDRVLLRKVQISVKKKTTQKLEL